MSPTNFTAWLYKPYLDLSVPRHGSPLHTFGVEFDYLNLRYDLHLPRIQSVLMPSFRKELIRDCRTSAYAVDDPYLVSQEQLTSRWSFFCDKLSAMHSLEKNEQARLLWLLNKLCFYFKTSSLEYATNCASDADEAEIAYVFAIANYTLSLQKTRPYSMRKFEEIAEISPQGCFAKVNASYQMVVQNVKHGYKVAQVEKWLPIHYKNIVDAGEHLSEFEATRMLCRYYRVAGFLPQMKNDFTEMTRIMQLAEDYANKLVALAEKMEQYRDLYTIAAREMVYPVFESRIKEALTIGDIALAESRAVQLVSENPSESRARMHLGQVLIENGKIQEALEQYLIAVELGPPGNEVSLFMAGQCYWALGDEKSALRCCVRSQYYDPMGVSPLEMLTEPEALRSLENHGLHLIAAWAQESLAHVVQKLNSRNALRDVQAYQNRQFNQRAS